MGSATPPAKRARARRQAAKRVQILEGASRAFAARPFHLVDMESVAREARVGKGTLYRYFPSKDDLYLGVVDEAFALLIGRLESEESAALAPPVALLRMIAAIVQTFAQHLPFFRLMHAGDARLFLRKKQVVRARRARIAQLLAGALQRGAEAGSFRKTDPLLAPSVIIGMVWGATLNHAHELPPELLAERIADLCLHGVVQAPGAPA